MSQQTKGVILMILGIALVGASFIFSGGIRLVTGIVAGTLIAMLGLAMRGRD